MSTGEPENSQADAMALDSGNAFHEYGPIMWELIFDENMLAHQYYSVHVT